ncbi:MAG: hypothetical protein KDA21_15150, partial [Phycisphaerales bacterium]|nr:hypothetical protein [Phycisphaerales bacterium]
YAVNPAFVTVSGPGPDGERVVAVDVSHLAPGTPVRLEFGSLEFDDNLDSLLVLDDVAVAVPAPGALMAAGVSGVWLRRRRRGD